MKIRDLLNDKEVQEALDEYYELIYTEHRIDELGLEAYLDLELTEETTDLLWEEEKYHYSDGWGLRGNIYSALVKAGMRELNK